jgi:hypothetical protein
MVLPTRQGFLAINKMGIRFCALATLLFSFCLFLGAEIRSAPRSAEISTIENLYADLNDASGIISTIDSGLFRTYEGKDRAAWQAIYSARRQELAGGFARLSGVNLSPMDARAVSLMKKAVDSMPADSVSSLQPSGRCQDAQLPTHDYAALRHSLYACFDEFGNNIEFHGKKLTRVSAMSMLGQLDDPVERKQLFLAFSPLWGAVNGKDELASPYRRLIAMASADATKNGSPMDAAADTIGAKTSEVETWLTRILDAWRTSVGQAVIEPWDFHYSAGSADRQLAGSIPRNRLMPLNQRYYHDIGADLDQLGILYDLDPRGGKAPLAYSDFVTRGRWVNGAWKPTLSRVSANYDGGGLGLLNELVHENGHAVHMAALRTRPAFMDLGDPLFFEAFADVTSWDTFEPAWQAKYLGQSAPESASMKSLFSGVVLDAAWALFELRMLRQPESDPNAVWTDITSYYLHVRPHPELSWWALRVQLVDSPGYMVNYGLGSIVTADIRRHTDETIGPTTTGNPKWYEWISKTLLRSGEEQETSVLLRQFLGRPVSADALLHQIHRIASAPAPPVSVTSSAFHGACSPR